MRQLPHLPHFGYGPDVTKLKCAGWLQIASLSLCPQFETSLMSNRKIIELLLQSKSGKTHGKNYIKVKPHLVRHL